MFVLAPWLFTQSGESEAELLPASLSVAERVCGGRGLENGAHPVVGWELSGPVGRG